MDTTPASEALQSDQEAIERISDDSGVLQLPVQDRDLVMILERKISNSEKKKKDELKIPARSAENENFLRGKHYDEATLLDYQIPYKDNIIYQDHETRISLAAGRMPDIVVTAPDDSKRDVAKEIETALDVKVTNEMTQRMLKDGLRLHGVHFIAAIKVRWDPNRAEDGDIQFELVHPTRIGFDHAATIPHDGFTADNMDLVYEWLDEPIAKVVAKFPNKKGELFRELGIVMGTPAQLANRMTYLEAHFTWYMSDGSVVEGVAWKYQKLILDKRKTPNWDWDGYDKKTDQVDGKGKTITEKAYRNFFERPRKPYILLSHQNLGKSVYDYTTPLEQAIPLQRIVNKRGRQITEISDRAIPKLAFAGKFIAKEEARRVTNDPDEHIWFEDADNISQAMQYIPAQEPSPILFNDLISTRGQIDSKFATHSITRGEKSSSNESGFSKQITREGDLTISDDIVSIVIERAVFEMASWALQLMKLRYDKPHFVRNSGKDGETVMAELTSDKIADGIVVEVKANTVDKATRRNMALELAAQKAIDPLSLFEDLDVPNPKERTRRLITFLNGSQDGYTKYLDEIDALPEGSPAAGGPASSPVADGSQPTVGNQLDGKQAVLDIQRIQHGEQFDPPGLPTADYIQVLVHFYHSPDFQQSPPAVQENFIAYVSKIKALVAQSEGGTPPTDAAAGATPPSVTPTPQPAAAPAPALAPAAPPMA